MITLIYHITKNNEIIFAQNFKYETKEEAQQDIKNVYNNIKTKDNIKEINYTTDKLVFTDFAEGESDEIHTFTITK